MLPGRKRGRGELPHKTMEQILEHELAPWSHGIRIADAEDDVQVMDSATFAIRTKYIRTVHTAMLNGKFLHPKLVTARSASSSAGQAMDPEPVMDRKPSLRSQVLAVGSASSESRVTQSFSNEEVLAYSDNGKILLYCWLTQSRFE